MVSRLWKTRDASYPANLEGKNFGKRPLKSLIREAPAHLETWTKLKYLSASNGNGSFELLLLKYALVSVAGETFHCRMDMIFETKRKMKMKTKAPTILMFGTIFTVQSIHGLESSRKEGVDRKARDEKLRTCRKIGIFFFWFFEKPKFNGLDSKKEITDDRSHTSMIPT